MLLNQAMRIVEGRYIESGVSGTTNQRAVLINLMSQLETIGHNAESEEAAVNTFVGEMDNMLNMWGTVPRFRSEWRMVTEVREAVLAIELDETPAG